MDYFERYKDFETIINSIKRSEDNPNDINSYIGYGSKEGYIENSYKPIENIEFYFKNLFQVKIKFHITELYTYCHNIKIVILGIYLEIHK